MQDRFLVRVFDTEENEMIYNAQATYDNYCRGLGVMSETNYQDVLESDRYIKMQCTGLKDKNGKLIYEGDILEWDCCDMDKGNVRRICKVVCDNCSDRDGMQHSRFLVDVLNPYKDNGDNTTYFPRSEKLEIIGNIYETPEVLEVKNV